MTLRPADLGNTLNNYIGRSQWSHDPYLNGNEENFVIFNRAISSTEVQALYNNTPISKAGDVNGDGQANILDAMLIAQASTGLNPANYNAANADVNCDNIVNINDALQVARYATGLVTTLGCN